MPSRPEHLSEIELSLVQDGAPAPGTVAHLEVCAECRRRMAELQLGVAAFAGYDSRRAETAPRAWQSLGELVAGQESRRRWNLRWMTLAAAAALVIAATGVTLWRQSGEDGAAQVETVMRRSIESRHELTGRLRVHVRGQTLFRPAVLVSEAGGEPEMERVRGLFNSAMYSWQEPLSARSFLAWRRTLRRRTDHVALVEGGGRRAYKVTTEDHEGRLRTVSLTLNVDDGRPARGLFDFSDQGTVEMEDAPPEPVVEPRASSVPVETPVGPADTLRVLAALHQIGADVDDPLAVTEDRSAQAVVVRGSGISPGRQQEIARAVGQVPRAIVRFQTETNAPAHLSRPAHETNSAHMPAGVRHRWEAAFGGPVGLQEATDRMLDASSSMLARANALRILAEKVPAGAEQRLSPGDQALLRTLRRDHAQRISELFRTMEEDLARLLAAPLPAASVPPAEHWQAGVASLVRGARAADALLNRMLAGSYADTSTGDLLRALTTQLEVLRADIARQQVRGE